MSVFSNQFFSSHEKVIFINDAKTNLKAIIAIHNTNLGPALGGCRFFDYSNENDAICDVLRLSKAMTYKASMANLALGGGKSVIIGDPKKLKSASLLQEFGSKIAELSGKYIVAEDVGTCPLDMEQIKKSTDYVVGLPKTIGGSGDPSIYTAKGVLYGIKACLKFLSGSENLEKLHVAIQGLGNVGMKLAELLYNAGAKLTITDTDPDKIKIALDKFNAKAVAPDEIFSVEADIFSPCAMGGVINDESIKKMKFKIIAGAANNQLAQDYHAKELNDLGIIYAPDYVINAGGLINVAHEGKNYDPENVMQKVAKIYDSIEKVLNLAKIEKISSKQSSDKIAEEKMLKNPKPNA